MRKKIMGNTKMDNALKKVMQEMLRKERLKAKKKKPIFQRRKEKRLAYYSGWHEEDRPVNITRKITNEKQKKL